MRFEVAPQALSGQAPVITRQGARLTEFAGELRGLLGVAGATGSPAAAAAAERFAQVWSQTALLLADTVAALGATTGEAAAYTATDAGVIPAGR
jgi:hypothetical protein